MRVEERPVASEAFAGLSGICGNDAVRLADKSVFVSNLGWLLSQTMEGVVSCEYAEDEDAGLEQVLVHFSDGYVMRVNVRLDSYAAVIRDVVKNF